MAPVEDPELEMKILCDSISGPNGTAKIFVDAPFKACDPAFTGATTCVPAAAVLVPSAPLLSSVNAAVVPTVNDWTGIATATTSLVASASVKFASSQRRDCHGVRAVIRCSIQHQLGCRRLYGVNRCVWNGYWSLPLTRRSRIESSCQRIVRPREIAGDRNFVRTKAHTIDACGCCVIS